MAEKMIEVWEIPVACPYCGSEKTKVYGTHDIKPVRTVKRYRNCLQCGKNFKSKAKK